MFSFVATAAKGTEGVLASELAELGAQGLDSHPGAVTFTGSLEAGYRVALHSRIASRVLVEIGQAAAESGDAYYDSVRDMPWDSSIRPGASFVVDFVGQNEAIRHTRFGALRTKDAIVDRCRERTGSRPDVDRESPDLAIFVHLRGSVATLSVDLGGGPL
ncbi:MAG: RNA methyltransferase, partial [Myxococcales bacterium]|nr:RNA methyltransferase [Myxococcales bacterium]